MFYIGLVHTDADGSYGISFPDFLGCVSAAGSFDDLMSEAKEALSLGAQGWLEDEGSLPEPTSLDALAADGGFAEDLEDAQVVRVPLVLDHSRPKRINISLNPTLLAAIDQAAKEQGMTRSAYLANAALMTLG